jgi:hypothetical protein
MFRETFCNTKHYQYSPSDLGFLTNKACMFLLKQFHIVYEAYKTKSNSPVEASQQRRRKIKLKYESLTMGTLDLTQLPTGYSSAVVPSPDVCDHCKNPFDVKNGGTALICGHAYHWTCYFTLDFRCMHCMEYYQKGIKENVDSFLKRLTADQDALMEDEEENQEDDEAESDETPEAESISTNEQDRIEREMQEKLIEINSW